MTDTVPTLTITPAPQNAIVSKFYSTNNPSSPAAVGNDDSASFAGIIDTLNPLQHLPVIGYVYRAITEDEASAGAKVAGGAAYGALLGGPIGGLISMASALFGELFGVDEALGGTNTAVAENTVKPAQIS